jgi:hypothetical protein
MHLPVQASQLVTNTFSCVVGSEFHQRRGRRFSCSPHFYQADYGSFSLEKRECDHMVTGNLLQPPCRGPSNAMLCFPF